jgi:hypothetical protein
MRRNRTAFRQPFPETADAVFAAGDTPPAILVFVDAWTVVESISVMVIFLVTILGTIPFGRHFYAA